MSDFKTNDTFNVLELVKKMVDHIKSPTEEGVEFFKETINDIECALHSLKTKTKTIQINRFKR